VAAGLVATAIIVVTGVPLDRLVATGALPPLPPLYLLPLAWPAIIFLYFGAFYVFGKMAQIFPPPMPTFGSLIINIATLLAFLACVIGDPLVWLINKLFPRLVDIRDLRFINPYFFIYIHAPDSQ
jgi:hypothetical protein